MGTKDLFDLERKTGLISGGSRDVALQIAEALGAMGARLVLSSHNAAELEADVAHLQRVITVASIGGLRGNPCRRVKPSANTTSNEALVNFTRALAGEWGAPRHHGQRYRNGPLPFPGGPRCRDSLGRGQLTSAPAVAAIGCQRGPESGRAAFRFACGQTHHRAGSRGRRWFGRRAKAL